MGNGNKRWAPVRGGGAGLEKAGGPRSFAQRSQLDSVWLSPCASRVCPRQWADTKRQQMALPCSLAPTSSNTRNDGQAGWPEAAWSAGGLPTAGAGGGCLADDSFAQSFLSACLRCTAADCRAVVVASIFLSCAFRRRCVALSALGCVVESSEHGSSGRAGS